MTYRMLFVYAVCVHPPRLWGALHAQVSLFGSGLTPDRNTEQTWLGEARNREVPPQALGHRRKRKGARDWHQRPGRGGAGPGSARTRNATTPDHGPRPRLALTVLPQLAAPQPGPLPVAALTPEEAAAPSSSLPLQAGDVGLTARSQKAAAGRARCPWSAVETGPSASRPVAAAVPAAAADPDSVRTPRRK